MGWFEDVTGTSSEQRDTYRSNKEAMGGRRMTQSNLDSAASVGALGRDSSGEVQRDSGAWGRAEQTASGASTGDSGGGRVTPADKRQPGNYLDMILNQAFGAPPVPMPAGARPGGAPIPATRPLGLGAKPATIHEMQQVQQGLRNGMSLEAIIGGALGGGAAVLAYEMWKANNAPGEQGAAFRPSGLDPNGPNANLGPMGPNPNPAGGGTGLTQPRPRIVDGVPFETDIIEGTFEELRNNERLPMHPTYNMGDDGISTPHDQLRARLPPPGPARMEPAVGGTGESINSSIIEPHSEQYYNEFGNHLKSMGVTNPGEIGITPQNAPQLWEGLTKAMQGAL